MGFFDKLKGFRWSLHIIQNENKLIYVMHENAVIRIVGYLMGFYANGGRPVQPWSLYLNCNHNHKSIKLLPEHFTSDGENPTSLLIQEIEAVDSGWQVKGGEPIFEDAVTKKLIKIQESSSEYLQAVLSDKPREITFYSVMDKIFGK